MKEDSRDVRLRRLLRRLAPLAGLAFVVALFLVIAPQRLPTLLDVRTVAVHAVLVATVGIGLTLVVIGGGIDLSVGSGLALASVCAAIASRAGWPLALVVLTAAGAGVVCGAYNGVLVGVLRLPAFIVTLGTLGFFRGLAKWLADGRTIVAPTRGLEVLVRPEPPHPAWIVAPAAWLVVGFAGGAWVLLRLTVFGRQVTAMGDNATAARFSGVPVRLRSVQTYTLCGLLVGVAGALLFARVTVGDPTIAVGLELDAIAAVVIGGASLAGGVGSVWGTLIGAVMMAYLRNRCTALGWPNFVQEMIVGHIIIAAVAIDALRRRSLS